MRAAVILAFFAVAILFVANYSPSAGTIGRIGDTVAKPFKYASLIAMVPEAKIEIPVRGVSRKQISDTWGAPRGADRKHQGQDIFAKRGTPIHSATGGYVWRIGENKLGGNTVWVIGAGGRVYYYAHLDRYADDLKVGDEVSTDSVIGYVGTSGNAKGTPPHLHFGVYTSAGAINPIDLF